MMQTINESAFKTAEEHAQALADNVAEQLQQIIATTGKATLALSGGRSPIAFFHALSVKTLPWENVTVVLVDERIVSTRHADSNTALLRQHLLINQAAAANFHGLLDDDLSEAQLADSAALATAANADYRQPDVIILGMGEDAHTASLFPHVADLTADADIIAVVPETAPYARLSLSLRAILAAKRIYLAIGGAGKMAVYEQAKQAKNVALPISCVLHQNQCPVEVYWHE